MRALGLALLALSLCACSIFNKPDRGRLDGGTWDVGMDAGMDAPDMGTDAGFDAPPPDAWVCPGGGTRETRCGDGRDDDCDGLVDCADPECIGPMLLECCAPGMPAVTETFTKDTSGWTTAGNWVALPSMANAITSNALSEMGNGPALIGMVNSACLQVDLGLELRFDVRGTPCTGTDCAGHMDVVIGPSASFTGMLTDDLAVRGRVIDGHLFVDVLQGGTPRATSMDIGADTAQVTINLAPGLARGMPAIVGTVTVTDGVSGTSETLVSQIYVTDRDVFGTSTCHGLRLGVQGTGTHVALDNVRIAQLDCSNPARFNTVHDDSDTIDAVTVSVANDTGTMGWGRGGIGDPALFEGVLSGTGTQHRFVLLYDGSPVDRASDVIGHLPLTIGGADTTAVGSGASLALIDDCMRWTPRGMTTFCIPEASAAGHAVIESSGLVMRDPTLYPSDRDLTHVPNFRVAWVGETTAGSPLSLFVGTLENAVTTRITGTFTPVPIVNEACGSIRNPLLLPLLGTTNDWLLLYVCDDMFPPVVHGATMQGSTVTRIPDLSLGPAELGPLAAQGVIDIAGVVFDYDINPGMPVERVPTYRLWLTTRPTTTDTAVLYVEGRPPDGSAPGTPPMFTRFAGNPVLTERSSVFGSCALGCQLHGITATRISNESTHVRLLVERWVDTGSGLTYGLVPLEQLWPSDD